MESSASLNALLASAVIACASCAAAAGQAPTPETPLRPFTVADVVGMTMIGDPDYWHHNQSAGRVAHYAPDGTKLAVVLRRGDLDRGVTEYSLLLYRARDLLRQPAPAPEVLLRMPSSSNREVFASLRWLPDNDTLLFLGERPGELRQVFAFDTAARSLRQLTRSATNVVHYSASADGGRILYAAERPRRPVWDARTRREGLVVADEGLVELVAGEHRPSGSELYLQPAARTSGEPAAPKRVVPGATLDAGFAPVLSPDGRHALVRAAAASVPPRWHAYTDPLLKPGLPAVSSAPAETAASSVNEFLIVDVGTGAARPLLDAPQLRTDGGIDARWAPDGASVLLNFVHLPLDGVGAEERERRAAGAYTAEIALAGQVRPLAPASVLELARIEHWGSDGQVALVRQTLQGVRRSFFRRQGDRWQPLDAPADGRRRVDVALEEGLNLPPRIVVHDPDDGRELTLLELNPQLRQLALARQEEIEWRASDGTRVRGGLYYPPGYVRGKRYPLVIQTHGYSPRQFAADGIFTSAFAAQALASRDIVVLQAWDFPEQDNEAVWQRYVADKINSGVAMHQFEQSVYEGAIDHLDAAGLIARDKVGLIGFSYTCWSVKYALTHPRPGYRYAAAAVSDGFDGGYWNYIAYGNLPTLVRQFEGTAGGTPYGAGLQAWLREAPGFNVDKVETPLRMIPLGNPSSLLNDWEWHVLLRRMGKPVELVLVEDGSHSLVKPWDRMVASDGNVDWFDFWLNGRKDPAPEKAAQYARWEKR